MPWLQPTHINERALLRVLVVGFTLVVAVLGWAGFTAVRSTRAIEDDAAQVGREQLAMARLLNDVQAGQNTMAAILHQLAPGHEGDINRQQLLSDLERADRALANLSQSAAGTPEAARWRELDAAVRDFSRGVREALERGARLRPDDLSALFDRHDRVVSVEQQLLESSERRMEATEQRIENESRELATNARILLGTSLALALVCAVITIRFARSAIRKIEWQARELSRVSWHMLQSQETLARRFSHELHDELGQSLAAVKANLGSGQPAACLPLVDQAIANVRELSQLLHPVILDDFGLNAGLRWLADGFAQRTGIRVDYVSTAAERMADDIETHLFRITQEALTNVARHASGATRVTLELHRDADLIRLSIEDNGRGLRDERQSPERPSLGLTGMRARAHEIGGEVRVLSQPGQGVRIEVLAPWRPVKETDAEQEDAHPVGR